MVADSQIRKHFSVKKEADDLIAIVFKEDISPVETTRAAQLVEDSIFEILNQDPNQTYNALLDITAVGGSNYLTPEAIKIYSSFPKLRQLKRSAVVGNNTTLEMFANFVISAAGKELNFRWCKTREEALDWLKKVNEG